MRGVGDDGNWAHPERSCTGCRRRKRGPMQGLGVGRRGEGPLLLEVPYPLRSMGACCISRVFPRLSFGLCYFAHACYRTCCSCTSA